MLKYDCMIPLSVENDAVDLTRIPALTILPHLYPGIRPVASETAKSPTTVSECVAELYTDNYPCAGMKKTFAKPAAFVVKFAFPCTVIHDVATLCGPGILTCLNSNGLCSDFR